MRYNKTTQLLNITAATLSIFVGSSSLFADTIVTTEHFSIQLVGNNWTPNMQTAVANSFRMWESVIENTPGRTMNAKIQWGTFPVEYSKTLADNSVSLVGPLSNPDNARTQVEYVWRDGNSGLSDALDFDITFNKEAKFTYAETQTDAYDFQSVLSHEIGHSIGFSSLCMFDTDTDKLLYGGYYTKFDTLITDGNGKHPYEAGFQLGLGDTYTLGASGLTLYNPNIWEQGSSFAHVVSSGKEDPLMAYATDAGVTNRALTSRERVLLQEMGWTVRAIPEPSMFGLLAGLGALALVGARRRRK